MAGEHEFEPVQIQIQSQTSGFDDSKGEMAALTSHIWSLEGAALAAGAALGFLATKALKDAVSAAASFEDEMAEVRKVVEDNITDVDALGGQIREIATSDLPLGQEELANITAAAARLGVRGNENLQQFTRTIGEMAVATEISAGEAADSVARLLNMLGLTAGETRNVAATVNRLSNTMATDTDRIITSAGKAASSLTALGATAPQTLALAGAVSTLRMSAARAGTRLRRVAQVMMNPDKVIDIAFAMDMTVEQFKRMRDEAPVETILMLAEEFENSTEKAETLRDLLPTSVVASLDAVSRKTDELRESLGLANDEFENMGSLAKEVEIFINTFHGQVKNLRIVLKDIAIDIGNFLLPVLADFVGVLTDLARRFQAVNKATDGALGTFLLLATALGGIGLAVRSVLRLFGAMGVRSWSLHAVMTTLINPFTVLPVLFSAFTTQLIRGGNAVQESADKIRTAFEDNILVAAERVGDTLTTTPTNALLALAEIAKGPVIDGLSTLLDFFTGAFVFGIRTVGEIIEGFQEGFDEAWSEHNAAIFNALFATQRGLDEIEAVWNAFSENVRGIVQNVAGQIPRSIGLTVEQMTEAFVAGLVGLTLLIRGETGKAADAFRHGLEEFIMIFEHWVSSFSLSARFLKEQFPLDFLGPRTNEALQTMFGHLEEASLRVLMIFKGISGIITGETEWAAEQFERAFGEIPRAAKLAMIQLRGAVKAGLDGVIAIIRGDTGEAVRLFRIAWGQMEHVTHNGILAIKQAIRGVDIPEVAVQPWLDLPPKIQQALVNVERAVGKGVNSVKLAIQGELDRATMEKVAAFSHIKLAAKQAFEGTKEVIEDAEIPEAVKRVFEGVKNVVRFQIKQVVEGAKAAFRVLKAVVPEPVRNALEAMEQLWVEHKDEVVGTVHEMRDEVKAAFSDMAQFARDNQGDLLKVGLAVVTVSGLLIKFSGLVTGVFSALSTVAVPAVVGLVGVLGTLSGSLTTLTAKIVGIPAILAGVTGAASVLIADLSALATTIGFSIGVLGPWSTSLIVAKAALVTLLSPVVLLKGAIVALGAAFITNFKGFRDVVLDAVGAVIGAFNDSEAEIGALQKAIDALVPVVLGLADAFISAAGFIFEHFINPLVERIGNTLGEKIPVIIEELAETIDALATAFRTGGSAINEIWGAVGDEVIIVAEFLADALVGVLGASVNVAITMLLILADILQLDFVEAAQKMDGLTRDIFNGLNNFFIKWGSGLIQEVVGVNTDILQSFQDFLSDVFTAFADGFTGLGLLIAGFLQVQVERFFNWGDAIVGIAGDVWDSFTEKAQNALDTVISAVATWGPLIVDAVSKWLKRTVVDIAGGLWDIFVEKPIAAGEDVISAIQSWGPKLNSAIQSAVGGATSTGESTLDGFVSSVQGILDGFISFIQTWGPKVLKAIVGPFVLAGRGVKTALEDLFTAVVSPILDRIMESWEMHGDEIVTDTKAIWQGITETVDAAIEFTRNKIQGYIDWYLGVWGDLWDFAESVATDAWDFVSEKVDAAVTFIQDKVQGYISWYTGVWEDVWTFAESVATDAWDFVAEKVDAAITFTREKIQGYIDWYQGVWRDVWTFAESIATDTWDFITQKVDDAVTFIQNNVQRYIDWYTGVWTDVWNVAENVATDAWDFITTAVDEAVSFIQNQVQSFISWYTSVWSDFWTLVEDVATSVWDFVTEKVDTALSFIQDKVQGFISWYKSVWSDFWSLVDTIVTNVWNRITSFIDTVTDKTRQTIESYVNLTLTTWRGFADVLEEVFKAAWNGIVGFFGFIADSLLTDLNILTDLARQQWNEAWTKVGNFFERTFNGLIEFITGWGGRIQTKIETALDNIFQAFVSFAQDLIFGSLWTRMFAQMLTEADGEMSAISQVFDTNLGDIFSAFKEKLGGARRILSTELQRMGQITSEETGSMELTVDEKMASMDQSVMGHAGSMSSTVETEMSTMESEVEVKAGSMDMTADNKFSNIKSTVDTESRRAKDHFVDRLATMETKAEEHLEGLRKTANTEFGRVETIIDDWSVNSQQFIRDVNSSSEDLLGNLRSFNQLTQVLGEADAAVTNAQEALDLKAAGRQGGKTMADGIEQGMSDKEEDFKQAGKDAGKATATGLANGMTAKEQAVANATNRLTGTITERMPGSDAETGPLSNLTQSARAIGQTMAAGMDKEKPTVENASQSIAGAVDLQQAKQEADSFSTHFQDAIDTATSEVERHFGGLKKSLVENSIVPELASAIKRKFNDLKNSVTTTARTLAEEVRSDVSRKFRDLRNSVTSEHGIIPRMFSEITRAFNRNHPVLRGKANNIAASIHSKFDDRVGNMFRTGQDLSRAVRSGLNNKFFAPVSKADEIMDGVISKFKKNRAHFNGAQIAKSLARGMRSQIGAVRNAANRLTGTINSRLPGSDAETGPLSELTDSANSIGEVIAAAILDFIPVVEDASNRLASSALPDQAPAASGIVSGVGGGTTNHFTFDVTVNADTRAGGEAAAVGFVETFDEALRAQNY